jgi:hypothetical protein
MWSDQHQLVEKESGDHGKTPSYKCCSEGILPGFQVARISRRLEVHNLLNRISYAYFVLHKHFL